MSTQTVDPIPEAAYPDSDGCPMAENTLQFEWIVTIKEGLEAVFRDDPNVFVAGDLLWYPVEGDDKIRIAPDAMVVVGRPKGYRGSYVQYREEGIAPQVVFEILSPGNRYQEMMNKTLFYEQYGVEEYYLYDPDKNALSGWLRGRKGLKEIPAMNGWLSPRLNIRFDLEGDKLRIIGPNGAPLATYVELVRQLDQERQHSERLAAQLRALGVEPAP